MTKPLDRITPNYKLKVEEVLSALKISESKVEIYTQKQTANFTQHISEYKDKRPLLLDRRNKLNALIASKRATTERVEAEKVPDKEAEFSLALTEAQEHQKQLKAQESELAAKKKERFDVLQRCKEKEEIRKHQIEGAKEKSASEIKAYERVTGLDVKPIKENHLQFTWVRISKKEPEKKHVLVLSLDESCLYNVIKVKPSLKSTPRHLEELNRTRDLYRFLKDIRRSFVELYQ